MYRIRRAVLAAAATLAAGTALNVSVAATASAHAPTHRPGHGAVHAAEWQLHVQVKNDSTHNMVWLGDQLMQPTNTPKAVLTPGDVDILVYKADSTGLTVRPTYQVQGTLHSVFPVYSVPLIGPNGALCTPNDRSISSPVGVKCNINSGWNTLATALLVNL